MNEFEWLRQTRALREPVSPRHDLWPAIDAALDDATSKAPEAPRRSTAQRAQGWLLAASFAGLSVFAGSLAVHLRDRPLATAAASVAPDLERWRPSDPRLAGAAVEFDAASMELRQAMEQAPHSPALQRLLYRMQKQQSQLRQLEHQAG
ncbi:hypothetical protein [Dyella jiangningensis]|uniref:Uncharacterized protein n=1 Tax=Dyella jiangningensis TaxID=1379159 RepID=A0A328P425_9GAMM|nr:hypothetical protein [Dyella jiangningensis]RAO77008.1 hypothetical protein CA260_03640 [Dyella jiangningensis]